MSPKSVENCSSVNFASPTTRYKCLLREESTGEAYFLLFEKIFIIEIYTKIYEK